MATFKKAFLAQSKQNANRIHLTYIKHKKIFVRFKHDLRKSEQSIFMLHNAR